MHWPPCGQPGAREHAGSRQPKRSCCAVLPVRPERDSVGDLVRRTSHRPAQQSESAKRPDLGWTNCAGSNGAAADPLQWTTAP